eukprot:TRINITY_DN10134_c0_g1_i1.p3 TRINITY_DN10134_c0_g1~~TRINITY_DN10134_c0_g1_i1.p3  ORF type:complete len:60 (-),score=10.43 TRINITY_DN10134_c0_g1_i1:413-592(-)
MIGVFPFNSDVFLCNSNRRRRRSSLGVKGCFYKFRWQIPNGTSTQDWQEKSNTNETEAE